MKPENSICPEIENFLTAKETTLDWDENAYVEKYNQLLHEQELTEQALAFDEKMLAVKATYDKEHGFSKKLNNLFLECLREYDGFADELKIKIRTTEIVEELRAKNEQYFSTSAILAREERLKKNIIAGVTFSAVAIFCLVFSIYTLITNFTIPEITFPVTIIIGVLVSILLSVISFFGEKKWYLVALSVLLILATAAIFITTKLACDNGVTFFQYLAK